MPLGGRHQSDNSLGPEKAQQVRVGKFFRWNADHAPIFAASDGIAVPSGTTGATNIMLTSAGALEWHVKGAGQTITAPVYTAGSGLNVSQDLAAAEGAEYSPGGADNRCRGAFTVGGPGFYMRHTALFTDASGFSEYLAGFRLVQAYQAARTSYTDYAAVGISASANPAVINQLTRVNTGTLGTQDSGLTISDGTKRTLEVRVDDTGKVRFYVDGGEPPVSKTDFVFDAGDIVVPFVFFLHSADLGESQFWTTPASTIYGGQGAYEFGFLPRNAE